jgi:hypothetical protein
MTKRSNQEPVKIDFQQKFEQTNEVQEFVLVVPAN